mgnify:FL=1
MTENKKSPLENPLYTLIIGVLKGFTTSMWRVSGEGSGGVSRAFGEDLWNLMNMRAGLIGEEIDKTNPQAAMKSFEKFLTEVYQSADGINYTVGDEMVDMDVCNCKIHDYTDYLEENDVPRSAGCPYALAAIAMMEDVLGNPYIIDDIKREDLNCKISLKGF